MALPKKQLLIEILTSAAGVKKGVDESNRHLTSMSDTASRAGGAIQKAIGVVAASAVVALGKELFQTALQSQAFQARFDAVFGAGQVKLKAWAASHAAAFGTAVDDVQGYMAGIANMLTPLGWTSDAAAEQAKSILETAAAWSVYSGGQISVMDAAEKLTKGMLGQTRGLQELGLNAAAVRDIEKDLGGETDELTGMTGSAADAQERWYRILEQSGPAMNMYGEAMEGPAGQALALQSATAILKDELADALLPVLTSVADGVLDIAAAGDALLGWFQNLDGPSRTAALAITGVSVALWAMAAHPLIAGLALVAGVVAVIGQNAQAAAAKAEAATARIEAMADAIRNADRAAMLSQLQQRLGPAFVTMLGRSGVSLEQFLAIAERGDLSSLTGQVRDLLVAAGGEGNIEQSMAKWDMLLESIEAEIVAATALAEVLEEQDRLYEDQGVMRQRLALSHAGLATAQERGTRTTREWQTALETARTAVINLINSQIEAASPTLQLLRARQGQAEAEERYAAVMADSAATDEQRIAAAVDLVEAEGRVQGAQAVLVDTHHDSVEAFDDLAKAAGLYGDELERIYNYLWGIDRAPTPSEDQWPQTLLEPE